MGHYYHHLQCLPTFEDDVDAIGRAKVHDLYNFMNRNTSNNGSYGNFEKIFPFNEETLVASEKYSLEKSLDARDIIVENVRDVFGEKYHEVKNHNPCPLQF